MSRFTPSVRGRFAGLLGIGLSVSMFSSAAVAGNALVFDFDTDSAGNPILPGQKIDNEYAAQGLIISATHPTKKTHSFAVAQDSSNPAEYDHITAGFGVGNTTPYYNVLIVPRYLTDKNKDGLIDAPESQELKPGAKFTFAFDSRMGAASVTILDADLTEVGSIVTYLNGKAVDSFTIEALGDNSVQTISFKGAYDTIKVNLGGSGAVAELTATAPSPSAIAGGLALMTGMIVRRRRAAVEQA